MKSAKSLLLVALPSVFAHAVDVKTCYVKIDGWNMKADKEIIRNLPVQGNKILAIDVSIRSDAGVYDKLTRSGGPLPAHYGEWPYFNRRGGFWRLNNSQIVLDAGADGGQSINPQKTYFRDGYHVQTGINRGWIRILHTGNQCSTPQPAVKTKVIMIQNFDMRNNSGMLVNNIHHWFGGSTAFQNIKGKILGFTTTVVSDPEANGYDSRYLTDLTMVPPGCWNENSGGSGCGMLHWGGTASIETASNRLHLVAGNWYQRSDDPEYPQYSISRPLPGNLFDNAGIRMFLRVDYYQ